MHACTGPELGTSSAPPELGLGGGMCWAALDRYLRGVEIPRDVRNPDNGDPLHTELVERQVAALAGLWPRIAEWQAAAAGSWRDRLPFPVPFGGRDVASRVRAEWRSLRRHLDADQPVLLTVLLDGGAYDRPRTVRQVLATDWVRNGSRVTLSIYDPDQPENDDVDLLFSLSGALNARLTGGVPIRGFMPVAYDRTPAPTIRSQQFDDRSVISLNRTVRGEPDAVAGRKHVDMVARNERGALLHFRRNRDGTWEGTDVMGLEDMGSREIHSDPVAVRRAGALHVFARDYVGDLLHFRSRRSWSVTNCTDQKRAGPQFRIVGRPVVLDGPKLQLSVIGRDTDGGLVHYRYAPIRGWRAEQVPGDRVADDPVAVREDDTVHVTGLATDGRLVHWSHDDVWTMTDSDAGPGPTVRLQGRPTMFLMDGRVHVIGRGRHNRLLLLRLNDDGLWRREMLGSNLAGDPSAVSGPGGFHMLAPTANGGLVHAWRDGNEWTSENVAESRPTLSAGKPGEAGVACWGTDYTLRAFVRCDGRLRVYTWTPDADWVCDPVPGRAGTRPMAFRGSQDEPHLVFTDGRGTLIHLEAGDWREPGRHGEVARTLVEADAAVEREVGHSVADDAAEQDPFATDEPVGADGDVEEPVRDEALIPDDEIEAEDAEYDAEDAEYGAEDEEYGAEDEAGDPAMDLAMDDLERLHPTDPTDGSESTEEPAAAPDHEPAASQEVLEFEAERLTGRDPVPEPVEEETYADEVPAEEPDETVADIDAEDVAEHPDEAADIAPEADDADEIVPEADEPTEIVKEPDEGIGIAAEATDDIVAYEDGPQPEDEDWDPQPPTGLPGLPELGSAGDGSDATSDDWEPQLEIAEDTPADEGEDADAPARPVRKFRWEDPKRTPAADQMEPMDLSLLDSWPPPSRASRRDRAKDRKNGNVGANDDD